MNIVPATVAGIQHAATLPRLAAEYAAESRIDGLPEPMAKWDTYQHLEAAGALHVFGAAVEGALVGFISVLAPILPHYGAVVAVCESFFVAREWRHTGAGLGLLKAAEDKAREIGSPGLLVCAPFEGDLFKVLPRRGYAETNRVFFKKVSP